MRSKPSKILVDHSVLLITSRKLMAEKLKSPVLTLRGQA
jgi:hypothetical protein